MFSAKLFFALFFVITCLTDAIPLLTSSLKHEGRTAACYGERVFFTCSVISGTGILQWAVESYHAIGYNPIFFTIYDQVGHVYHDSSMLFNATLTQRYPHPTYAFLGNLTSQLSLTSVSDLDNKLVQCSDGVLNASVAPKLTFRIGVSQQISAPQNIDYTVERFSVVDYSIKLMWEAPDIDGGVGISNYTITVVTLDTTKIITTDNMTVGFQLLYNINHFFEVVATNCLGRGVSDSKTIFQASCGHPSPPANGTIETYYSTQTGSKIQYHCNEGYTPMEWRTSQCQENGSWIPDPREWNCITHLPVNCGRPASPLNGSVFVNFTTVGSYAMFTCDQTLQPTQYKAVCTSSAVWEPDPYSVKCIQQGDCGIPLSPDNGTVEYTSTRLGTALQIFCNPGFVMNGTNKSICETKGWLPAPDSTHCVLLKDQGQKNNTTSSKSRNTFQSPVIIVGLATSGTVMIIFLLGIIGIIICCCRAKSFKRNGTQEEKGPYEYPVYEVVMAREEDMELNKNPAYEVVMQRV